jgi:hypothetical protein
VMAKWLAATPPLYHQVIRRPLKRGAQYPTCVVYIIEIAGLFNLHAPRL